MSYQTIVEMSQSQSLKGRILAAAAQEGIVNTQMWVDTNLLLIITDPGWADAWEYAKNTATLDQNPDTGVRPGVINDAMILAAVQTRKAELEAAEPEGQTGVMPAT